MIGRMDALHDAYMRAVELCDSRYNELANDVTNTTKLRRYREALHARDLAAFAWQTSQVAAE